MRELTKKEIDNFERNRTNEVIKEINRKNRIKAKAIKIKPGSSRKTSSNMSD